MMCVAYYFFVNDMYLLISGNFGSKILNLFEILEIATAQREEITRINSIIFRILNYCAIDVKIIIKVLISSKCVTHHNHASPNTLCIGQAS